MKTNNSFPTPYPEINSILDKFQQNMPVLLGNSFIGLYLHGSLAYGDFNLQTSDIDFLVVTETCLPQETISPLKEMHARIFLSGLPWSQKLEGAYISRNDLRRHDPATPRCPFWVWMGTSPWKTLGSDLDHPALDFARERHCCCRSASDRPDRPGQPTGFRPGCPFQPAGVVVTALSFPGKIRKRGVPGLCRPDHVPVAVCA